MEVYTKYLRQRNESMFHMFHNHTYGYVRQNMETLKKIELRDPLIE